MWTLAVVVPLVFLAAFFAYPVAAIVARGFVANGALDLGGFADVLGDPRTWRVVAHTLEQAVAGTVLAVVLAVPGAYVLYRCSWPGRGLVRGLVAVPFVLPSVVVGVAFRALLASHGPLGFLGLDRSFPAIVAALVFFNYGLAVRLIGTVWERLDPRTEQAARTLGASPARAFLTVTLPALGPAIASAASLVFLFCATAFAVVLVLGGQRYATVEVEIWLRTTQFLDLRTASVLSVIQLVVVAVALWVSARARSRGERALRLVEAGRAVRPLRPLRSPVDAATAALTALVVALVALPLLTLVVRSFRRDGAWTLANYAALSGTGRAGGGGSALTVSVWAAAQNSLRIAVDATLLALVVGITLSLVLSRRPRRPFARRAIGALDSAVMLPLGVSAVTVGFGFLIALDRPPLDLRSSLVLIPIAQAMVAIPLVVRTILPVLRAIDPRLRQAAAVLGAAPGRVLATVDLPLALRSIGLAAGFAFAVSLGEFGATSFLARPDRPTLPVVIFRLLGRPGEGNYEMAVAASVVLAVVVGVVMTTAERLRPAGTGDL
ncbi:thiamine transport system permease protein [Salana multivorans]|uniref:Thiamine transport system permease protein n=1 Tax=Salana multivorans TaxID=120377 RepID=A0A3N2DBK6_9MICO|nr:iron ABC transporter permease [Salana multivorans]ROR96854.1 thiamine transport system permease protein [Salana multivorans]